MGIQLGFLDVPNAHAPTVLNLADPYYIAPTVTGVFNFGGDPGKTNKMNNAMWLGITNQGPGGPMPTHLLRVKKVGATIPTPNFLPLISVDPNYSGGFVWIVGSPIATDRDVVYIAYVRTGDEGDEFAVAKITVMTDSPFSVHSEITSLGRVEDLGVPFSIALNKDQSRLVVMTTNWVYYVLTTTRAVPTTPCALITSVTMPLGREGSYCLALDASGGVNDGLIMSVRFQGSNGTSGIWVLPFDPDGAPAFLPASFHGLIGDNEPDAQPPWLLRISRLGRLHVSYPAVFTGPRMLRMQPGPNRGTFLTVDVLALNPPYPQKYNTVFDVYRKTDHNFYDAIDQDNTINQAIPPVPPQNLVYTGAFPPPFTQLLMKHVWGPRLPAEMP